jgi:phosphatidylserine synthase
MIQRKQSLWLFLAALLNAGVFLFNIYETKTVVNGVETLGHIKIGDDLPALLIAIVMVLLPLVTIFMYKDRKRQIRMSAMGIVATCSFITLMLARVGKLSKQTPPPTDGNYWIGMILPFVAIIFLILAIIGIRKDEKLVRSADRLR